ncbi:MerR family transcriptional regulator [Pseudonocardia sp. CA-107938]|uniref:MerR family transcriptional regulator n=1 Tax=Pseudonocardia sp. CA-107938 TaxID=3240021 RepID=UPI003D9468F8
MRPVDVARAAGVSSQLVRDLLAEGVLPPAGRTPGGHRILDERHRAALLAHRALVAGYGHALARDVMLAVHAGEQAAALALLDAGHADLHAQRLALEATAAALAAVATAPPVVPESVPREGLLVGELAHRLRVRASALRVWEAAGLLHPVRDRDGYRRYDADAVRDARLVVLLRQSYQPFPQIRAVLDGVRRSGDTTALHAALEARRAAFTVRARAMLTAAAALDAFLQLPV